MAQAVVDVVATQAAHEAGGKPEFFNGAVRACECADAVCAVVLFDVKQAVHHIVDGGLPIYCAPLAHLLNHGAGEALGAVERLVAEAVAVGQPAFIDGFILKRLHPHDAMVFDLHNQICACGVVRADGFAPPQLPGARTVAKGFAGDCAYGANVYHVARQF